MTPMVRHFLWLFADEFLSFSSELFCQPANAIAIKQNIKETPCNTAAAIETGKRHCPMLVVLYNDTIPATVVKEN
jgi:hypothetical protein